MLDAMRQQDPLGRRDRELARRVAEAQRRLRGRLARDPAGEELAQEAGLSSREFERFRRRDEAKYRVPVANTLRPTADGEANVWVPVDGGRNPEDAAQANLDHQRLARLATLLDERERYVIESHFLQERALNEIARELDVSPSRVGQLLRKALQSLRGGVD